MSLSIRIAAAITATAAALASLPALALEPFRAEYQASYMGMQANGAMTLAREGQHWRYSLQVQNQLATLSQSTLFEEKDGRLRPLSGHDSANVLVKKRKVDAVYDWAKGQATWTGDIKPERAGPVALRAGDMDALLINLAIARDLAAGRTLSYRMVDEGRIKPMTYHVAGKEQITVNGKPVEATKVSRTDGRKELVAWIVADMPVPARLLQREDGKDALDLTIKSIR